MKEKIHDFLKRIVYTKIYVKYYSVNDNSLRELFNHCQDGSDTARDKIKIAQYIKSDIADKNLELSTIEKNHSVCLKKKAIKKKDKNGNKEKGKVVRKLFQNDEQNYSKQMNALASQKENLDSLCEHIRCNKLSDDDMSLIRSTIYNHRINSVLEISIALAIIITITFFFVKRSFLAE